MQAREIMSTDVVTVQAKTSIHDAARVMRERDIGLLFVVDASAARHCVGALTDRDIVVRHVAGRTDGSTVSAVMTGGPLISVLPETDIREVARRMSRHQLRRLPVVDADGRLTGVVAQADLAIRLGSTHPELVEHVVRAVSCPRRGECRG